MTEGPSGVEPAVDRALRGLVSEGVITQVQAEQVAAAVDREVGEGPSSGAAASSKAAQPSRLPEVLGYLGGAFVVAAALLVMGFSWADFSYTARLSIAVLSTLVTLAGALGIGAAATGGLRALRRDADSPRCRLVGVLLVVSAACAAGTVALVLDHGGDGQWVWVPAAGLLVAVLAVVLAPGLVPTLGVFAASVALLATVLDQLGDPPPMAGVLAFALLGLGWVTLGWRLTGTPVTALTVGLGVIVVDGWVAAAWTVHDGPEIGPGGYVIDYPAAEWGDYLVRPVGLSILAVVVAVGLVCYLRGGPWPWLAAGSVAAVALVFEVAGDAFGPAVASLAAGVVLLGASGLLVMRRNRSGPAS